MATLAVRRLEFVAVPAVATSRPPDRLDTGRVVLDPGAGTFSISLLWSPTGATWYLDLRTTSGAPIVLGTAVRDRVDCLLGVSTRGRPAGAIMSYDPRRRGDPTLTSWSADGVGLFYVPAGLDPNDLTLFPPPVI